MVTYWKYDSAANKAVQQNVDIAEVGRSFSRCTEPHFYQVNETGNVVSVECPNTEFIVLINVTLEQAVILFANLLNDKEAAKE